MINSRLVVGAMVSRRLVVRLRITRLTQHGRRVLVNRSMHTAGGTMMRLVPVIISGRSRHTVNVGRVMMRAMIPRCGTPVRYKAQSRQRSNRVNCYTGFRVSVYRAAIGITINRETIGVITCIRPCHRRAIGGTVSRRGRIRNRSSIHTGINYAG